MNIITNENLEDAYKKVIADSRYGFEGEIIEKTLQKFPSNIDEGIIAMKIALIDMTNSTNLNKHLGKIKLNNIIKKIKTINFDERVKLGDETLIDELSAWSKNEGVNLFSFFSKYCLYHNYYCYKKDDFVIYDSVLRDNLINFITPAEYGRLTSYPLHKNFCDKLRNECNYSDYKIIIDFILLKNNITVSYKRRKFDLYVWYLNRTKNNKKTN